MPYKYLKDVTYADVAFAASGTTLNELFESAGLAVTNTMVRNLEEVKPKVKKTIKLKAGNLEKLLFEFLQEFVFWKDKSLLLFSKVKVKVSGKEGAYKLSALVSGEKLDMKKHSLIVDVKAVTWHLFKVEKKKTWSCQVVLDV
jgi:SHS2 domain-containing protein